MARGGKKVKGTEVPQAVPEPTPVAQPPQPQARPKSKKGLKVALLVIFLVVIIAIILAIVLLVKPPPAPSTTQYTPAGGELVTVGTPGAAATINEDGAVEKVLEGKAVGEGQTGYVFCRQLSSGDKIATMGDDKYSVSGPAWFVYVDENPGAFFEHDVKYIFVDASTGETKTYAESWPPDVNGDDIFTAADDCGGAKTIYAS